MFFRNLFFAVAILGLFTFSVSAQAQTLSEPQFPSVITSLADADYNMKVKTLDGKDFSLSEAKGKVIFINIWATWCPSCVAEMPGLQKLYDQLKNEVVFVLVSVDEESSTVSEFLKDNNYSFPVYYYVIDEEKFENFPLTYQVDYNHVEYIPSTFIISREGKVVFKADGGHNYGTDKTIQFLRRLNK